ncbi:hypothetical protein HK102_012530 [Quaeritorhiza haematococci]|nr:hypothetical protein HK102_012530 [Quaeritorhiza haematococci]
MDKEDVLSAKHRIEEAMTEALLRECPKCKKKFFKTEGCNKMLCSCGQLMCYVCRKAINGYDHFATAPDGRAQKGVCPLWDDTNKRNADEVQVAQRRALDNVKGENPEVDEKELVVEAPTVPAANAGNANALLLGAGRLQELQRQNEEAYARVQELVAQQRQEAAGRQAARAQQIAAAQRDVEVAQRILAAQREAAEVQRAAAAAQREAAEVQRAAAAAQRQVAERQRAAAEVQRAAAAAQRQVAERQRAAAAVQRQAAAQQAAEALARAQQQHAAARAQMHELMQHQQRMLAAMHIAHPPLAYVPPQMAAVVAAPAPPAVQPYAQPQLPDARAIRAAARRAALDAHERVRLAGQQQPAPRRR